MTSESEYLAPMVLFEKERIASQIVWSTVPGIVEQQHRAYHNLWNKAIPAEEIFRDRSWKSTYRNQSIRK